MKTAASLTVLLTLTTFGCGPGMEEDLDLEAPSSPGSSETTESSEQGLTCSGLIKPLCDLFGKKVVEDTGGQAGTSAGANAGRALFNLAGGEERLYKGVRLEDWPKIGLILWRAFAGDNRVTLAERKEICAATGGLGVTTVLVKPCRDGYQEVEALGFEKQRQRCTAGTGENGTYENACIYKDPDGWYYFDDGPSMPGDVEALLQQRVGVAESRYNVLFWAAGQQHDYCYHHTDTYPRTIPYNQYWCDNDFLKNMNRICEAAHEGIAGSGISYNLYACKDSAITMFQAVRVAGEGSYRNMKTLVNHEHRKVVVVEPGMHTEPEVDVVTDRGSCTEPPSCGNGQALNKERCQCECAESVRTQCEANPRNRVSETQWSCECVGSDGD